MEQDRMEQDRMEDLLSYRILGNQEETELNELAELASLICNSPISLITLIDEKSQWFKAKVGTEETGTKREDAFCIHTIPNPHNVLIVPDATKDSRFISNPLVTGEEKIKFYAGAPILSDRGNVLGTICVLDREPRELSEKQQAGLLILAKKVHKFMRNRKLIFEQQENIEKNAEKLRKLTFTIPSTIFQLRRRNEGNYSYDFISLGEFVLPEELSEDRLKLTAKEGFDLVLPADQNKFLQSLEKSYSNLSIWNIEYRVQFG